MEHTHDETIGGSRRPGASFQFWLTPFQAIGLVLVLTTSWARPAESAEHPAVAAVQVVKARIGELVAEVRSGSPGHAGSLAFREFELISTIDLVAANSRQKPVYLVPGLHWHQDSKTHFGLGLTSGLTARGSGLTVVAAFQVRFR